MSRRTRLRRPLRNLNTHAGQQAASQPFFGNAAEGFAQQQQKPSFFRAVQTKAEPGTAPPQLSSKIKSSAGKGTGLPGKTLTEMNTAFGVDFSSVKIHADAEAAEMNTVLGAQAFAHGQDVYFNQGKYRPETSDGKHLLAHELTHVVQQQATSHVQPSLAPNVQTSCAGKSVKNCRGSCTHGSGYPGTCRWTGVTNGCVCFENPRNTRSLEEVLPYWITAILSAAALAALAACFASGVCEAGIIIGAAGAAAGAVIIGIFEAAGVQVTDDGTA